MHGIPKDPSVETTFPAVARAPELPRQLRVVTFNLHIEPGAKILHGLLGDPALRDADLIFFEEVHRDGLGCSAACAVARKLGFYAVYAPGHANGDGDDGVAIVSRAPITSSRSSSCRSTTSLQRRPTHRARRDHRARGQAGDGLRGAPRESPHVHDRRVQMTPVLDHAQPQATPVIIAGDFNTSPFTWIAHVIPIPTGTQDDRFEELVRVQGLRDAARAQRAHASPSVDEARRHLHARLHDPGFRDRHRPRRLRPPRAVGRADRVRTGHRRSRPPAAGGVLVAGLLTVSLRTSSSSRLYD